MLAYSYDGGNPRYGYVKLNEVPVWQSSHSGTLPLYRGVNILLVGPHECSLLEWRHFDTCANPDASTELSNYLQQLNRGTIIVGVSADEPTTLLASALPTLREMGANVADVQYRGAFGFVAQKGFPAKTVLRKAVTQVESNANQPNFNATITGATYCRSM